MPPLEGGECLMTELWPEAELAVCGDATVDATWSLGDAKENHEQ